MRNKSKIKEYLFDFGAKELQWDGFYNYTEYNAAYKYAQQHKEVLGVSEVVQKLRSEAKIYENDINDIIKEKKELITDKFESWKQSKKLRTIAILITVLLSIWTFGYNSMMLFVLLLAVIVTVIVGVRHKIIDSKYQKLYEDMRRLINHRNQSFSALSKKYYQEIDDLYLISLNPTQRELVLLRRDQARQQEKSERMQKQLIETQKELARAIRRGSEAQEGLLTIEREREERRKRGY